MAISDEHVITDSRDVTLYQISRKIKGDRRQDDVHLIVRNILSTLLICLERKREIAIPELGHFRLMRSRRKLSRHHVTLDSVAVEDTVKDFRVRLEWLPTTEIKVLRKGLTQWQRVDEPSAIPPSVVPVEVWANPPKQVGGDPLLIRRTTYAAKVKPFKNRKRVIVTYAKEN